MRILFLIVTLSITAMLTTSEKNQSADFCYENDFIESNEIKIENENELLGGLIPPIKRPRPTNPSGSVIVVLNNYPIA